jgi:hypothetical protein
MSGATEFTIGSEVLCTDGSCGELARVIVNPVVRAITHLAVDPRSQHGTGRLVPVELVDSAGDAIHIRCTLSEFQKLRHAEETHFLNGGPAEWGYDQGHMLTTPLFALGGGMGGLGTGGLGMGMSGLGMGMGGVGSMDPPTTTEDRVPEGDAEVSRGERVHATDGEIGRIHGFVVDPADHRLTHVLLDEGHLWGKKTVAIPVSAVTDVSFGVRLNITKAEVAALPEIDLADPLK